MYYYTVIHIFIVVYNSVRKLAMNNTIKSISILISFKPVKRRTISKAIATSLLAAKSRKIVDELL